MTRATACLALVERHKNKRARGFLLELSKVAATYSPTLNALLGGGKRNRSLIYFEIINAGV